MDQRVADLPQHAREGTAGSEERQHRTNIFVRGQSRILPILSCRDSHVEFLERQARDGGALSR